MIEASPDHLLDRLRDSLRCPACRAGIEFKAGSGEILCAACSAVYPVLRGAVPVLLIPEQRAHFQSTLAGEPGGRKMVERYRRFGTWHARVRAVFRPPAIVYDEDAARKHSWIYDTSGPETVILSVGGGPGRENPRVINLNLDAFDSVDLVGDGANLPLADCSVDTVTCNAVIEHVPNPTVVVDEIFRVLRPGGHAQFMIPFVFPFHEFPGDYQRFTARGIAELTRRFEKLDLCVLAGPTSALLVMLREYLRLVIPGGERAFLRPMLNGISGWLTFWLKYLDRWLNRKPGAAHLAAAFYYLGRKPANQA